MIGAATLAPASAGARHAGGTLASAPMSEREIVVLGTASRAPTRDRNHPGVVLRFDGEMLLFDPGEGTQRQLLHAGVPAARIGQVLITHAHGDHCLGLPGVLQRMNADSAPRRVDVAFPAGAQPEIDALRRLAPIDDHLEVCEQPSGAGPVLATPTLRVSAAWLDHRVDTLGYRVDEPGRRHMLPERLAAAGVAGPDIGRLQRAGAIDVGGRRVTMEEVSAPRPGQSVAVVMDTRWCDGALALAADADLLVSEATFLDRHAHLAHRYGHLTVTEAARLGREAAVRRLVLIHFSARYPDLAEIAAEARAAAAGEIDVIVARDLQRVALPPRL